jgi:hypothetical protein
MRARRWILCLGALSLVGLVTACSDDEDSSANTTTTANQGFSVDTPEGQLSLSLSGSLPPNWPDDFPVPEGAEPAGSGSLGGSSSTGFVGVYSSSGSPQDTFTFYTTDAGLDVTDSSSAGVGGAYVGNVSFGGSPSGSVTVVPYTGGGSLIIILLSEPGSGTTVAS